MATSSASPGSWASYSRAARSGLATPSRWSSRRNHTAHWRRSDALGQRRAAGAAAAGVAGVLHLGPTQWALRRPGGEQALPYAIEPLLEREPAADGTTNSLACVAALGDERHLREWGRWRERTHETLLKTPTTRPMIAASRVRMGSMDSFSGWSRMWSDSRKKRLTVASSPTS